ncbi:MAG: chorismate synthase [Candidatus Riflebacteria bacterium]|nr:chorismate synthase [Candidatus Riflebacteria bacterium]
MLRYLTAGESHGRALLGILEGMPAGVPLVPEDFAGLMDRRQGGYGRGPRRLVETDQVEILSGVWRGLTIGSPIGLLIWNRDHRFAVLEPPTLEEELVAEAPLTVPIPGHADLAGALKYGFDDARPVRERASARETAIRAALSVPARRLLEETGIRSVGFTAVLGEVPARLPARTTVAGMREKIARQGGCFATPDARVVPVWKRLVDEARERGDSLGGVAEVWVDGLPPGLGSHVDPARRLDARLAAALMAIPAVRAVEIGQGISQSAMTGKKAQDPIRYSPKTGWTRPTNLAGGIEGGMTNGERLVVRCFMKPIPGPCRTGSADLRTGRAAVPAFYRSDTTAVDSLAAVAESMAALELAGAMLEKFGGDTLDDLRAALAHFRYRLPRPKG